MKSQYDRSEHSVTVLYSGKLHRTGKKTQPLFLFEVEFLTPQP